MSNYQVISNVRSQLDSVRQSSAGSRLATLKASLGPAQTPYDRVPEVRRTLMSFEYFAIGASGRRISPPRSTYLYRASSLTAVQKHTQWREDKELPLDVMLGSLRVRSMNSSNHEGWFGLSDVAEGELSADRSFTWWSSSPINKGSAVCDLHFRGIPNDWIPMHALLLRCSVDRLLGTQLVHTPSVLDGFDSVIFEAISEVDMTTGGRALSVESPDEIQLGADEFVLKPIPVDFIEILPLVIDESLRKHKVLEINILSALEVYYMRNLRGLSK